MSNTEHSVIKCKKCGVKKTRYFAGRFPNGKDKIWIDENGIQWSGATCSTCHKENVAERKRNNKKIVLSSTDFDQAKAITDEPTTASKAVKKRMADGLLEGLNQALVMEKNKP